MTTTVVPLPPPTNLSLKKSGQYYNTFSWSPPTSYLACNIASKNYHISTSHCGVCPNVTNETSVVCTGVPMDGGVCVFGVKSEPCGNETKIEVNLDGNE